MFNTFNNSQKQNFTKMKSDLNYLSLKWILLVCILYLQAQKSCVPRVLFRLSTNFSNFSLLSLLTSTSRGVVLSKPLTKLLITPFSQVCQISLQLDLYDLHRYVHTTNYLTKALRNSKVEQYLGAQKHPACRRITKATHW